MRRVTMFSRVFPAYHPLAGQPTRFVEKFLQWYWDNHDLPYYSLYEMIDQLNDVQREEVIENFMDEIDQEKGYRHKVHTIRAGERYKPGDMMSPRVWLGKPYRSKQLIIAPDIEIKQVWDFEIKTAYKELPLDYDTDIIINHNFYHTDNEIMKRLADNDGLSLAELLQWFKYPKPFKGQIVCWDENIKY